MTRVLTLSLAIGILGASAVFALAEAIHHAGLNPFTSPAASREPALATAQPLSQPVEAGLQGEGGK